MAAMSTRRAQIIAEVDAVGADSPAARQLAAYATRAAKQDGVAQSELEARWQERFTETGFDLKAQRALTSHAAPLLWTPDDDPLVPTPILPVRCDGALRGLRSARHRPCDRQPCRGPTVGHRSLDRADYDIPNHFPRRGVPKRVGRGSTG